MGNKSKQTKDGVSNGFNCNPSLRQNRDHSVYNALNKSIVTRGWCECDNESIFHIHPFPEAKDVDWCLGKIVEISGIEEEITSGEHCYFAQLVDVPFRDEDLLLTDRDKDGNSIPSNKGWRHFQYFDYLPSILKSSEIFKFKWVNYGDLNQRFDLNNDLFMSKSKVGICLFNLFEDFYHLDDGKDIAVQKYSTYLRGDPKPYELYLGHFWLNKTKYPDQDMVEGVIKHLYLHLVSYLNKGGEIAFQLHEIDFDFQQDLVVQNVGLIDPTNAAEMQNDHDLSLLSPGKNGYRNRRDDQIH